MDIKQESSKLMTNSIFQILIVFWKHFQSHPTYTNISVPKEKASQNHVCSHFQY